MNRQTGLTMGVIVALVVAVFAALNARPALSPAPSPTPTLAPVLMARLLPIRGDTLDGQTLTLPADLRAAFNLVVMPFNRDQQTAAVGWLAPFAHAAANDERVEYYSVAALTDLTPLVRTLVVQGLNVAVRDAETRQRVVVAFLDNQAEVVAALGAGDTAQMRVLIVAADGRVLWQTSGEHTPEREAALLAALAEVLAADAS